MQKRDVQRQAQRYVRWRKRVQRLFFNASQGVFSKRRHFFQYLVVAAAFGFGFLTTLAKQTAYFPIDLRTTLFIQRIQQPWFTEVMKFLTYLGGPNNVPTILLIIATIILSIFKKFKEAIFLIVATLGSFYLSESMKDFVGRVRPDAGLINQVSKFARNDSFPSGHVLYFVGFYGFLTFLVYTLLKKGSLRKALMTVFIAGILLIGPSRIYLGAHWFSDTLGAYLLGFLWLSLLIYLYEIFRPQVKVPEKS